jgi:hypothetical protein
MPQVKIHKSYRDVVAIADPDLIDKKFEEGKLQLDIKSSFYQDSDLSKEELLNLIQKEKDNDATFNIVGENSIAIALESGIITKESVGKIQNIPYALTLI